MIARVAQIARIGNRELRASNYGVLRIRGFSSSDSRAKRHGEEQEAQANPERHRDKLAPFAKKDNAEFFTTQDAADAFQTMSQFTFPVNLSMLCNSEQTSVRLWV